jgi:hypothetical protein
MYLPLRRQHIFSVMMSVMPPPQQHASYTGRRPSTSGRNFRQISQNATFSPVSHSRPYGDYRDAALPQLAAVRVVQDYFLVAVVAKVGVFRHNLPLHSAISHLSYSDA